MSSPAQDTTLNLAVLGTAEAALPEIGLSSENEVVLMFDQLRNPLLRYTMSLGIGISDGEDLIQEVFLSLFRHLQLGRPRSNLRGWVFRVAHNLALKQRNSRQKRNAVALSEALLGERQIDPSLSPEEQLADTQRQKLLVAVMLALPEVDQNCLRLRAEGLRYREIAEVLGISLGAVSNSLTRAFERLNRAGGR
jgi:RNA polymerase sigma-70 factor (ECF subfamily)